MKNTERNARIKSLWVPHPAYRRSDSNLTQKEIGAMFGLKQTRVAFIISGQKNKYRMCQSGCGAHITIGASCIACKARTQKRLAVKRLTRVLLRQIHRIEHTVIRRDASAIITNMRKAYRDELRERRNFWSV